MEDWEQFFVEKSRRRFDKERADRRRHRNRSIIRTAIVTVLVVAGIVAVAVMR